MKANLCLVIAALLAATPVLRAANVTSNWALPVSDFWETPARWANSNGQAVYPDNGADTYDVIIGVPGSQSFAVGVVNTFTVNNLTVNTASAIISHYGAGLLSINNALTLPTGSYYLSDGILTAGSIHLTGGGLTVNGTGTVTPTNITLNGSTITGYGGGAIIAGGTGHLTVMNHGSNILDGIALTGGITLDQLSGRVRLINDANFNGHHATLSAIGTVLSFEATATDSTMSVANATINMDGSGCRVGLDRASPLLTLESTSSLRGRGAVTHSTGFYSGSDTQFVNQGIVSADLAGQTLTFSNHVVTNGGTMRAINGATLDLYPLTSFTNSAGGTISATGGSTVILRQHWHNQGGLVLEDTSIVWLHGSFTTADLGLAGWSRSGGTVNVAGTLNNTGGEIDLITAGAITLAGGAITGGTLHNSPSARLLFTNNILNTLDGVSITGGLVLDTNSRVQLRNDAAISGNVSMDFNSMLGFVATVTDNTFVLDNTIVNMNGANNVSLDGPNPQVTIAPGSTLRGHGTVTQYYFSGLTTTNLLDNQGHVNADVPGQSLTIAAFYATNSGTMSAFNSGTLAINPTTSFTNLPGGEINIASGSALVLQKNWHNQGALILHDTSAVSLQGTFTTADLGLAGWSRSGGTVNVAGTLNNTGDTLSLNAATGHFVLAGGSIVGGTLNNSADGRLVFTNSAANVLDGVIITGGLTFDQNSSQVRLRNDPTISGTVNFTANANGLYFDGTATDSTFVLAAKLTLNLDGTNANLYFTGINPSVTLTNSIFVRGHGTMVNNGVTGASTLINEGRIVSDTAGQTLTISPNSLTNTGRIETANGGILNIPSSLLNQSAGTIRLGGGWLQVTGSQAGPDMTLGATARLEGFGEVRMASFSSDSVSFSGTLAPDPGVGGIAIKGDLVPTSSAVFAFDIAGTAQATGYDFVSETGSVALDLSNSALQVAVANGYSPPNAQPFIIISSNQTITGQFGNVASGARITSTDGLWTFLVTRSGSTVTLSDAQPSPAAAYVTWARASLHNSSDPAIIGPGVDFDFDGVPNLVEFALKGDPASSNSRGLMAELFQDVDPSPGSEFTFIIAFRQGAVFSQQPDGSQKNVTAVDTVHCTVQGSASLEAFTLPMLHLGPSFTAPAGTGLPDLSGSGWEYHTFFLDPAVVATRGFIRAAFDGGP